MTDSTWNHVALVVRGRLTDVEEEDQSFHGDGANPKRWAKHKRRDPRHFHVCESGKPHLLEASGEGVHIYDLRHRLLEDPAYHEYATVAVRSLSDAGRLSPERLEAWIAKVRGTEFEKEAPFHALFTEAASDCRSMHCAELVTATYQHMGLVPRHLCAGTAPPCAYADRHHVRLKRGRLGPLEIVKAAEPAFAAVLSQFVYGKPISKAKWLCLIPVIGGVIIASLKELDFAVSALIAACSANLFAAFKGNENKKLMETKGLKDRLGTVGNQFALTPVSYTQLTLPTNREV